MTNSLIIVSVGTDHHPFDRLVNWMSRWACAHETSKVIIQRGPVAGALNMESHDYIPHDELRTLFRSATAVVSHGGPSTVMDARMAGKFPIVVPRDPKLGEHVDGHQLRFAQHLADYNLARLVHSENELGVALDEAIMDPEAFEIPLEEARMSAGVVSFGRTVDDLLGISTKLRLYELEGVDERESERRYPADRRSTDRRISGL